MLSAEVNLDVDIDADDVMQAHRERMEQAGQLGLAVSKEEVPVDTGILKASGFGPEWRGETLIIGYTADHALDMEEGTDPIPASQTDTDALMRWAERIGRDPGFGAWVANTKIPERGVAAQPYLAPAAERMQAWIQNRGFDLD